MGVNAISSRGRDPRNVLTETYRASRRFALLITVKGMNGEFMRRESRDATKCHREGQEIAAKGTLTVHDQFYHRIPDAPVLSYRVFDRVTGNDVLLADASMAPEYATPADLAMWRTGFARYDTAALRTWVECDAKGGAGTPYQEARSEIAAAELAGRAPVAAPVKRMPRGAAALLDKVA